MNAIMQQQAQVGEQLQEAQQELQKLQQENQSLKVKADIEAVKNQIAMYEAETQRLVAYADIIKAGEELKIKQLEQEAHNHEMVHSHMMDVANLAQQDQQHEAEQETARQAAQAKSDSGSQPQSAE